MSKRYVGIILVVVAIMAVYPLIVAAQTGTNYALGKPYTTSVTCQSSFGNVNKIVTDSNSYSSAYITDNGTGGGTPVSLTIDLKSAYTVNKIRVWHYWDDGRTFHDTKTEVSEDGNNWTTVFDSLQSGEYQEASRASSLPSTPSRSATSGTGSRGRI